jgi:phosphoribosylglycinamide formyltransferase-1
MQAIIDACKDGRLNAKPCVVISNNSRSTALERARKVRIPSYHLSGKTHPNADELDSAVLATLQEHQANLVILAGYMKLLGPKTVGHYRGRILNVHPALLPRFGGKHLHGRAVHEAVLSSGERVTGVTIHLVDEEYDHGPIVAQSEVAIRSDDTVDSLAERVLRREHEFYVETLQKIGRGEIKL